VGKRFRIGIVGAGNITSLRHIPALRRSGRVEIVGIVDRRVERARAVAERFGLPNASADMDARWFEDLDAVTVGVPPMEHAAVTCEALRRGKHVLQEKPTAMTPEEGERIAAEVESSGRTFAIVHNFQFANSALRLRKLLDGGTLGRVLSLNAVQTSSPKRKLPVWAESLPLGLFYDESPHFMYLFRAFGGRTSVVDVSVRSHRQATPHILTAHLDCEVAPGFMYCNFQSGVSEWHFAAICERGTAIMDVFRDVLVFLPEDGGHTAARVMTTSLAATATHWAGVATSGVRMVNHSLLYGNDEVVRRFLDAAEASRQPEKLAVADALDVLRLQHDILTQANRCESTSTGRA
jgi:scyllo-inositol 2-dehydrogenase (NADP+)